MATVVKTFQHVSQVKSIVILQDNHPRDGNPNRIPPILLENIILKKIKLHLLEFI